MERLQGEAAKRRYLVDYKNHVHPEELLEFRGTLGSGTYADVYHCILTKGDEKLHVAVKKMKPELLQNETDVNDFFRETELLLRASEPGNDYILSFIGVTVGVIEQDTEESLCIIEEYMDKGTLKSLIEVSRLGQGGLSRKQLMNLMIHVAHGLAFLHMYQASVIHRDIKPSNILIKLDESTGDLVAKLADFGLNVLLLERTSISGAGPSTANGSNENCDQNGARRRTSFARTPTSIHKLGQAFQKARTESRLRTLSTRPTQGGLNNIPQFYALTGHTGSLAYMAPEVHLGQRYNHRADVFSFGVMLFETMGHVHPYIHYLIDSSQYEILHAEESESFERYMEEYANAVANDEYRPKLRGGWPAELAALIVACWSKNPHQRPAMVEVVARLEAIHQNCPADNVFQKKCKWLSCIWPRSY